MLAIGRDRGFLRGPDAGRPGQGGWTECLTNPMSDNAINLKDYQLHETDTGSAAVQIALMTERILHLTDHLSVHRKDVSSRRGLLRLVAQRRTLLDYLKATEEGRYQQVIQGLGLRK